MDANGVPKGTLKDPLRELNTGTLTIQTKMNLDNWNFKGTINGTLRGTSNFFKGTLTLQEALQQIEGPIKGTRVLQRT